MPLSFDSLAIENFKEYLRIQSVQPHCDYISCVNFLKSQACTLGLPIEVHEVAPNKPVVVINWLGTRPDLTSILLSSHMDVVPVFAEEWTYNPFGAEEDEEGNIYARGAQDMKCVGIQYLEAVRKLITQGFKPKRSVHICFTPDEEIGSLGMKLFIETDAFRKLNIGCGLDEGVPSSDESFNLFYGERSTCSIEIICPGTPGHGSLLHANTPGEKICVIINKFMERREMEQKKLMDNPNLKIGDITTINLTTLNGGVLINVVPPELKVGFDCRLGVDTNLNQFENWIRNVCKEAGEGVKVKYLSRRERNEMTNLDAGNPWWVKLNAQFEKMELKVNKGVFPGGMDAMYLRKLGIPAFNFSPMNNTPVKAHDHNEFLNKDIFLNGIEIYSNLITALTNV